MRFRIFGLLVMFLILISQVSAESNESFQARELIGQAKINLDEMVLKNISILRANESYQEAVQLYGAQYSLEELGRKADYKLVLQYALEVGVIKKDAFKANNELKIFLETYKKSNLSINLSDMQKEYDAIVLSFEEERFEDTLKLINGGYDKLSEVQSSQTALKLFYSSTSKSIKEFLRENWSKLLIGFLIAGILLIVFKTALSKLMVRMKLSSLKLRKETILMLIKHIQKGYFEDKKVSALEYHIKLKKFEDLVRDIERERMVLREKILLLGKGDLKKNKKIKLRITEHPSHRSTKKVKVPFARNHKLKNKKVVKKVVGKKKIERENKKKVIKKSKRNKS